MYMYVSIPLNPIFTHMGQNGKNIYPEKHFCVINEHFLLLPTCLLVGA